MESSKLLERIHLKQPSVSSTEQRQQLLHLQSVSRAHKSSSHPIERCFGGEEDDNLSIRGTSSKLYNKHFTSLPQTEQVARHFSCCILESNTHDECDYHQSEDKIELECPWYNSLYCPLDSFKGYPEVRTKQTRRLSHSPNNQQQLCYRIPKLLEVAFEPDIYTSYSYKCAVRNNQNVLSPQTVNISLVDGVDKTGGHFPPAPFHSPNQQ